MKHESHRRPVSEYRSFGLGDAVAAVAKPVARAVDAVAGTDLTHCAACEKRRKALNKIASVKISIKKPV